MFYILSIISLFPYHHHHQFKLIARSHLTLSPQPSLSTIIIGKSSMQCPLSIQNWCKFFAVLSTMVFSCIGFRKRMSLISLSFILQKWTECLAYLTWMVDVWEIIYGVTFYMLVIDWKTTNHRPLSAHLPYHRMCGHSSNYHPFFPSDTNDVTRNLACWQIRLRVITACGALHMRMVIPWETLRTWGPKILLLQTVEFVRTSHQDKCYC